MRIGTAIVLKAEIENGTVNDRNQRVEVSTQGQRPSSYSSSETWLERGSSGSNPRRHLRLESS